MKELQDLARRLLLEGRVDIVIGYQQGPRGVRPSFVTRPEQADALIFDERCVHNLVTYLSPRRAHLAAWPRRAVVVKGCDTRAVAVLLRESHIDREDIVLIGLRCGGVHRSAEASGPLTAESVAFRCADCSIREPELVDHLLGDPRPAPPGNSRLAERIGQLESMSHEQRREFWNNEFSRCIRCHACRQVCPMCYCERCIADKTRPRWIESSAHLRGNTAWNMIRAMHLAGRCVGCGECGRACPVGIPLGLLNRKLAMVVDEHFDYRATDDPEVPGPLGSFRSDDAEEFIV